MAVAVVNIGGLLVRREAIAREAIRIGFAERRNLLENLEGAADQLRRPIAIARFARLLRQPDEAVDDPGGAVAILAAILAHARRVIDDAAGIRRGVLEERLLGQ